MVKQILLLLTACSLMFVPVASAQPDDVVRPMPDEILPRDCFVVTHDIKPIDQWDNLYQDMADCVVYHYTGNHLPAGVDVDVTPDPYLHCLVEISASQSGCTPARVVVKVGFGITVCYLDTDGGHGIDTQPVSHVLRDGPDLASSGSGPSFQCYY